MATTRPETMLGDTAVAIHSTTEHHKQYHGRHVIHPLTGRRIPIIIDDVLVNPEMGTGVVKVCRVTGKHYSINRQQKSSNNNKNSNDSNDNNNNSLSRRLRLRHYFYILFFFLFFFVVQVTPAHDPDDYACGQRHQLPFINILNQDGTLNDAAGQYKVSVVIRILWVLLLLLWRYLSVFISILFFFCLHDIPSLIFSFLPLSLSLSLLPSLSLSVTGHGPPRSSCCNSEMDDQCWFLCQ